MTGSSGLAPFMALLPDTSQFPTTPQLVEMLIVIYLVSALAYITYGLRMYTRITSKQLGLDDCLMTAAVIFSVALVSVQFIYYKYNYCGIPKKEIPFDDPKFNIKAWAFTRWLNQVLYSPILGLVKASTLVLMLRIAGHVRSVRRAIYAIQTIIIALTISQCAGMIFAVVPVPAFWDDSFTPQHKIDTAAFITSTSTLTVVTDFLVLSVPFWVFIRSQLPRATRCGVILIFMTSGLVTIIGIIRLCVFFQAYYEPADDSPFMQSWGPTLNTLETSLGITTACLPTLSPLLRTWFPRLFSNFRRGGGSTGQSGGYRKQGGGGAGGKEGRVGVQMADFSHRHMARSLSESPASPTGSHEGFFKHAGIRKTTDIRVAYSNRSITGPQPGEIGRAREPSSPAFSDPALVV